MVIGNEEELFKAIGHNYQENRRSPSNFQNTKLNFLFQK